MNAPRHRDPRRISRWLLRGIFAALAIVLGGSATAGAHGLPTSSAAAHSHLVQHSGHSGHQHVGEENLQRSAAVRSVAQRLAGRRRGQHARGPRPVLWRRITLRKTPLTWAQHPRPPPIDLRLRTCLSRV